MKTISQNIVIDGTKSLREAENKALLFKALLEDKSRSKTIDIIESYLYIKNFSFDKKQFLNVNFSRCYFSNASFDSVYLNSSLLSECYFENCDFSNAYFLRTNFDDCYFDNCSFFGAELRMSCLDGSVFENCSFSETDLSTTRMYKTEFITCSFTDVRFCVSNEETIISDLKTILFLIESSLFSKIPNYANYIFFKYRNEKTKNKKCKSIGDVILENPRRIDIDGTEN